MGKGDDPNCAAAIAMVAPDATDEHALARPARRPRKLPADPLTHLSALDRPHDVQAQLPEQEQFEAWHEQFSHNGLTVVRDDAYMQELLWLSRRRRSYRGKIMHAGREVGYVERHVYVDGHGRLVSEDGRLRIRDLELRGQGFGAAWAEHLERTYRDHGVDLMEITAVEVGAYLWATRGYVFDPRRAADHNGGSFAVRELLDRVDLSKLTHPGQLGALAASKLFAEFKMAHVDQLVWSDCITAEQAAKFRRQFATARDLHSERWRRRIMTPAQIAQYGKDEPFTAPDGRRTWLGKYLLTGDGDRLNDPRTQAAFWHGIKLLSSEPGEDLR